MATDVLRPNTADPHWRGKNGYNNDELEDTTIKVNNTRNVKVDNVNQFNFVSDFSIQFHFHRFLNVSTGWKLHTGTWF